MTDNAPNMVLLRSKISNKYKHIFSIGCSAHALNLLIQDIIKTDDISLIYKMTRNIVVEIKNSSKKSAKYKRLSNNYKIETGLIIPMLKLSVKTRYDSLKKLLIIEN